MHKFTKVILANSKAIYKELIEEGVSKKKIKLIYNGVLPLKKKINNHKIKRELGIKQDTTFIFSSIANLIL